MKLTPTNLCLLFILLLASTVEFAQRYVTFTLFEFWIVGLGMLIVTLIGNRLNNQIGPTLAFFSLVHFTRHANEYITTVFEANFSGTYFLLPVVLFTLVIVFIKPVRDTMGWWKKYSISRKLIWQMLVVVMLGSIGMYIYLITHEEQLSRFIAMLPRASILKIIILGIVFAGMNAIVEEFIIRGMIWNGLEKVIHNPVVIVTVQAIIFGVSHYFGLPGGIWGMSMIFIWSLFIGYVRLESGLLAAIGLHFFANLIQFFMLYLF